ncbi:phosphonate C-P lyase system protein PhnH [Sporolactobacillus shoreae]|uniref:Phosphonate C-P lyase system protein PhnH n=1 Tax=Sporolactobacillus shoreae TaxID=1465501 RepID=A0A4Z0GJI1_9BACL|nr:phosphonate C-P lyase system protein PhnH [Sporolactobacillus shoreae]TGA96034.1 phosphonate C-P lyase system protein PhnH [Sporolactobacillus shoreae]
MINTNLSHFDEVRDTQMIYRQLLDCMARPGKINSVLQYIQKIDADLPCSPRVFMMAATLLDREVTFHLLSQKKEDAVRFIEWRMRSRQGEMNQADYLFIDLRVDPVEIDEMMDVIRVGTLQNPDQSATLILCVDDLSDQADLPLALRLRGPGIQEKKELSIAGMDPEWFRKRRQINEEYPIGCDFILISATGKMAALPRTTLVESEGL